LVHAPEHSLRRYGDEGIIPTIRNKAGQRLFEVVGYLQRKPELEAATVCYCRVSSNGKKDDLVRLVQRMQSIYPGAKVIRDIGLGLNWKRFGLKAVLERAIL
jgi:predicted site-specific integrase-resolvase